MSTYYQLREFVPEPAVPGYFFIKSKLAGNVIDIQGESPASGVVLNAVPMKSTGCGLHGEPS